jgi:hypothetical protein
MTYREINTNQHCIPALTLKYTPWALRFAQIRACLTKLSSPGVKISWQWAQKSPHHKLLNEAQLPQPRHAIAMDEPGFKRNGF